MRSESQPPIGRATTASTTNPAVRMAALSAVRPYAVFRYAGRYTLKATNPPKPTA
jgi:hypothetical protein